jgi:thymidine kinase
LLFLSSFVASSTLVASSDTIDNLNIISVICGRVASVAADLAKSSAAR